MLSSDPAEAMDAALPAESTLSADATESADSTDQGEPTLRQDASIICPACQTSGGRALCPFPAMRCFGLQRGLDRVDWAGSRSGPVIAADEQHAYFCG